MGSVFGRGLGKVVRARLGSVHRECVRERVR